MKILLVHNFYRIKGGEDWYVEQLERLLIKHQHEVKTYFRSSCEIKQFNVLNALRFPFDLLHSFAAEKDIEKIAAEFKPDVIHVHNVFPLISASVYRLKRKLKIPIVQSVHNYRLMCLNGLFMLDNGNVCERCKSGNFTNGIVRRCYQKSFLKSFWMAIALQMQRYKGWLWRQVDLFICPTSFVSEKLQGAGCPPEKIREVPYFVPDTSQPFVPIVGSGRYALYLGRLSREKGIRTLLDAFEGMPEFPLVIAGGGPMVNFVKSKIQEKSFRNVTFLGFVSEEKKKELLREATCLIFPSECYETTGITMLESFQVGTPVVASRFGRREYFVRDGENGRLFEVGNSQSLQQAIRSIFHDVAQDIGIRKRAHKTFDEKFSELVAYKGLMNSYEVAVNNSWNLAKL